MDISVIYGEKEVKSMTRSLEKTPSRPGEAQLKLLGSPWARLAHWQVCVERQQARACNPLRSLWLGRASVASIVVDTQGNIRRVSHRGHMLPLRYAGALCDPSCAH